MNAVSEAEILRGAIAVVVAVSVGACAGAWLSGGRGAWRIAAAVAGGWIGFVGLVVFSAIGK